MKTFAAIAAPSATAPITGSSSGFKTVPFPARTLVREVEILATADGTFKLGTEDEDSAYGSSDYQAGTVLVLVLNRSFAAGTNFYLRSTSEVQYIIHSA